MQAARETRVERQHAHGQCGVPGASRLKEDSFMKAMWHGQVIAESDRTIELDGYHYFPPASVRVEFLQSAPKTEGDHRCPHSVQFFNLSDGTTAASAPLGRTRRRGLPTPTWLTGWRFGTTSSCNADGAAKGGHVRHLSCACGF